MNSIFKMKTLNYYMQILSILVIVLAISTSQTSAQNFGLDTGFNGGVTDASANNYVSAVQQDGRILVGGSFNLVNGVQHGGIARLNADGTLDPTFNIGGSGANGDVLEIVVLGNGKILIGGSFGSYNGSAISELARLNSNGTLDTTFNVGGVGVTGGRVTSLSVQTDSKIIVSGQGNTAYNGNPSIGIFRANADGSFDNSFVSGFAANPSLEQAILQPDGKIIIAQGISVSYGGNPAKNLIRVTINGSFDSTFNTGGTGPDGSVAGLGIQTDGKILIGGGFTTYNGTARNSIARLNTDGSLDTSFVPPSGANLGIEYFAIQSDGKILAAGFNTTGSGFPPVIRLNTNGTQDTSLNALADSFGYHVTLQSDGKILVTGGFNQFTTGDTHNGIVRFNTSGSLDNTFNPSLTGYGAVNAMVFQADGKTIVGGRFRSANGNFSNGIARFNLDGAFDNSFVTGLGFQNGQNFFSSVNALAVQSDGKILVGGQFGTYNGSTQRTLVRLGSNGSVDTSFNLSGDVNLDSFPNVEDILVLPDGKIIIGGISRKISTSQVRGLLRLNSDGSIDETFNTSGVGASNLVRRVLRQTDGKYIIGGQFTTYNGTSRPRVARINTDGTLDTLFAPGTGAASTINDAALQADGKIIIGGFFTSYNGTAINRIARVNTDGTLDSSFNVGKGTNNTVNSVVIQTDGRLLIGGLFSDFNGNARSRLARLNSNGNLDDSLLSGLDNASRFVNAMLFQPDGKLLAGGTFTNYNGATRNSLVRLTTRRTPFDFDGDGKTDISIFRPSVGEWYYQRSSNSVVNGAQFGSSTDKPAPADYTGDGKTDIAFFRPSSGEWFILRSEDSSFYAFPFGVSTDIPSPGDFDGDGKADQAVFRPSNGVWYIQKSTGGVTIQPFGVNGDRTVAADYDGDGKSDIAIFRPSVGEWYYLRSTDSQVRGAQFGSSSDKTVQGDYTGDGKADFAFFRPSTGSWFVLRSEDSSFFASPFGVSTDIPTIGDYDGDGKFDQAVFRPSNGVWYINRSTAGVQIQQFGVGTDLPVPSYYLP
jgi:uncharacterized delta-60 repeat protein